MGVDVTEVIAVADSLRRDPDKLRAGAETIVRKTVNDAVRLAKRFSPVDTGATRNSIGADFTTTDTSVTGEYGPTTEYSPHLEYGTWKTPPRPFIGASSDAVEPAFLSAAHRLPNLL